MSEQTLTSAAAARGPLAMEAISLSKDFRISRGHTLRAVQDVSFNLYRGAVVALVGESGSGKSTAARLLAGQERLTSGTIRLDGTQVEVSSRGDFRRYKSEVQLVFQDPFSSLNPIHTVRYHLERPVKLHQGKDAKVGQEVASLMEQVRLTPAKNFLAKYPHELSGGQRQRVSFARALAARPRVASLLALSDSEGSDPQWVGAVWDSHHPHRVGESPADVYANLGRRILLAQVKDARRTPDGDWELVLLGEGEVPVREMLGLLASGGYGTGSRSSGRSAGTPRSPSPRSRCRSTAACWPSGWR